MILYNYYWKKVEESFFKFHFVHLSIACIYTSVCTLSVSFDGVKSQRVLGSQLSTRFDSLFSLLFSSNILTVIFFYWHIVIPVLLMLWIFYLLFHIRPFFPPQPPPFFPDPSWPLCLIFQSLISSISKVECFAESVKCK